MHGINYWPTERWVNRDGERERDGGGVLTSISRSGELLLNEEGV